MPEKRTMERRMKYAVMMIGMLLAGCGCAGTTGPELATKSVLESPCSLRKGDAR